MYDVLEGKKEKELRVYESDKWIMNIDWECDINKAETELYCLAMPLQRDLQSVRDLNGDHLEMLKEILNEGTKAIE